ncbi:MAG: hypothetical protein OYL92_10575 [Acidobacteriota bacterium]|nr:hypothetical protein [Acidobacteriota bacterium]MDE3265401.1 hypothetical protein [Acidobacteriota bacterium]
MKPLLLALLGAVILVPTTLLSEGEDPFDQRMREEDEIVTKHARALTEALAHARKTGDYTALPKVSGELVKAQERYAPSQMDMWEARQRLIEYIYDSDDETVFSWYALVKESMKKDEEIAKGVAEIMAKVERMEQNLATQGVSLTPESLPPED